MAEKFETKFMLTLQKILKVTDRNFAIKNTKMLFIYCF
jgi:hypothetical protein